MLRFIKNRIDKAYEKKVDATGLAVFRILYFSVLLCEVGLLHYFRHLMYDPIPYKVPFELNLGPVLVFWMITLVFLIFGAFTRVATLINYIFSVVFFGCVSSFEYHMVYIYMGINTLMVFLPVSKAFSVDRILLKLKYSNTRFQYTPESTVSSLAYFIPVFVGIAMVYFDSIFYKLASPLWLKGLGLWLPSSVPMITIFKSTWLLNQELLVKFLGYLTLVFEVVFIFLFWFKRWRVPLMIIGIGLHLGILVEFPIPLFALGVCAIYILMVPAGWWKKLLTRKQRPPVLKFYYDAECPLCIRTRIVLSSLDHFKKVEFRSVQSYSAQEPALAGIAYDDLLNEIYGVDSRGRLYKGVDTYLRVFRAIWFLKPLSWLLRVPGIYQLARKLYTYVAGNRHTERCTEANCGYTPPVTVRNSDDIKLLRTVTVGTLRKRLIALGMTILVLLQVSVTYNSLLMRQARTAVNWDATLPGRVLAGATWRMADISNILFGVHAHAVFIDSHFESYNHLISVSYKNPEGREVLLPITDEDGFPGWLQIGPNWAKWGFRINGNQVTPNRLREGLKRFTAFWMYKQGIDFNQAEFVVKVKEVDTPTGWEKDFLQKQISHSWINVGGAKWQGGQFLMDIADFDKE
ncbi:DCC1-like thiol-disulfide oxidoreductase family protein [Paraflavisolibacter sp. H34]|uniref:DCC1-like thiol-disulfide oxidoreductase family protein n=1 Tax=Huijunlia imazamoxiresistens TaxID=3127457 RepID=UPI003016ED9B